MKEIENKEVYRNVRRERKERPTKKPLTIFSLIGPISRISIINNRIIDY